jgi:hypothetical protein
VPTRRDGVHVDSDVHAVIVTNHGGDAEGAAAASAEQFRPIVQTTRRPMSNDELSPEELAAETGEELPDREAMSLINANIAAPVNVAAALNVASDNSVAYANAQQTAPITQTN